MLQRRDRVATCCRACVLACAWALLLAPASTLAQPPGAPALICLENAAPLDPSACPETPVPIPLPPGSVSPSHGPASSFVRGPRLVRSNEMAPPSVWSTGLWAPGYPFAGQPAGPSPAAQPQQRSTAPASATARRLLAPSPGPLQQGPGRESHAESLSVPAPALAAPPAGSRGPAVSAQSTQTQHPSYSGVEQAAPVRQPPPPPPAEPSAPVVAGPALAPARAPRVTQYPGPAANSSTVLVTPYGPVPAPAPGPAAAAAVRLGGAPVMAPLPAPPARAPTAALLLAASTPARSSDPPAQGPSPSPAAASPNPFAAPPRVHYSSLPVSPPGVPLAPVCSCSADALCPLTPTTAKSRPWLCCLPLLRRLPCWPWRGACMMCNTEI
jgi:hypothetical protein